MIAIFRNYTPFAVFLLFLLTILTRLAFINSPDIEIPFQSDYVLWNQAITGGSSLINGAVVLILIILQSLYINKIANRFDLFNNPTYLTAMTYILITGLVASWNYLSIYLVVNLLVIALFEMCLRLYEGHNNPFIFVNIGIISACITLIFWPGLLYL